jgi:hypothetical protein
MTKRLDRLNPSNSAGIAFQKLWQKNCESLEEALDNLESAVAAIQAAQDAADLANAAATAADTAAAAAQTTADGITEASELSSSFVTGATITATDAGTDVTVTISAHTRHYPQPDGSTVDVSVNGGSVTALAYSTSYYIYYDDPSRAGGAVTYAATTSTATAAQIGDRHCVGGVLTPAAAAAPTGGRTTEPAGPGNLQSNL